MKKIISRFISLIVVSAVLLPGLMELAADCEGLQTRIEHHNERYIEHSEGMTDDHVASSASSRSCDHQAHHCGGPFHHGGCGHVTGLPQTFPVFDLLSPIDVAFSEFIARAVLAPVLDGPLQPPRA